MCCIASHLSLRPRLYAFKTPARGTFVPPPPPPSARLPPPHLPPLSSPLQTTFPDALNYFSFIIALLCTAPPAIGLCDYTSYVRSSNSLHMQVLIVVLRLLDFLIIATVLIAYRANQKKLEEMERNQEEARRVPPPYLCEHIRACKM